MTFGPCDHLSVAKASKAYKASISPNLENLQRLTFRVELHWRMAKCPKGCLVGNQGFNTYKGLDPSKFRTT